MDLDDPEATLTSKLPTGSREQARPPGVTEPEGVVAGRYKIDKKLGEGGYGSVYRATHLQMGSSVALKLLHANHAHTPDTVRRFELEARRSAQLQHPHCIRVFDFGPCEDDGWFIAMEFLDGRTLAEALAADGWLPVPRAVVVLDQTLAALEAAHDVGLVHRDLKPDNIFLTRVGKQLDFVKVLDFGIAKAMQSEVDGPSITASGVVIGTPTYMSPEQCRGDVVDPRSDLYSLGCVAFAMLSGSPPFKGDSLVAYLLAHVQQSPPELARVSPQAIPSALAAWVARCLEKDPARRFPSAEAARAALAHANPEGQRILASVAPGEPYQTGDRLPPPPRPRRGLWLSLGALAVGIGVALAVALGGGNSPRSHDRDPPGAASALPAGSAAESAAPREASPASTKPLGSAVVASRDAGSVRLSAAAQAEVDASRADARDGAAGSEKDPTPAEKDVAPAEKDASVAAVRAEVAEGGLPPQALTSVQLDSTPTKATVIRDGRAVGETPLELTWPAGATPPEVYVEAPGYVKQRVPLHGVSTGAVRRVALARPARGAPRSPAPAASVTPGATVKPATVTPPPRPPSDFVRIEDSP